MIQPRNIDWVTDHTTTLTGIKQSDVENAPLWKDQWRDFAEFTQFNRIQLAAHMASNDESWLKHAYRREQLGYAHKHWMICTTSMLYGWSVPWGCNIQRWSLKGLCKYFDLDYKPRHRGLYDARKVVEILQHVSEIE